MGSLEFVLVRFFCCRKREKKISLTNVNTKDKVRITRASEGSRNDERDISD
jgi:hypothetical protein